MALSRLLSGFARAAQGSRPKLKTVSELDPALLAKARQLALGVGAAAGMFGSLVGAGGGVLIGPIILNTCPAIPQRIISGTSLAAVVATGATAGAVFWSSSCVDARHATLLAASAVLTAPLGARMTHKFNCQRLRQALGWWLYIVAPLVPLKAVIFSQQQQPQQPAEDDNQSHPQQSSTAASSSGSRSGVGIQGGLAAVAAAPSSDAASSSSFSSVAAWAGKQVQQPFSSTDAAIAATGMLAGYASGLLGIGGGTVVTPLLALATGAPQQMILGTSLVAMVLPSMVGLAQHQRLGNVDWRMGAALAVGTTLGSYAGSSFAVQAPPGLLEAFFAVGMLLLGRRTLVAASKGVPKVAQDV